MVNPPIPLAPADLASVPRLDATPRTASWRAFVSLTKPQLATFSVLTTAVACLAASPTVNSAHVSLLILGTSLSAAGALSLNQWRERDTDAIMLRTRHRPLPAGDLSPRAALIWSLLLGVAGVALLAATVNVSAATIAALTILIYGVIYTPLKRRTRWATEIGAVSGALPALIGNAGAGDLLARPGLVLTAVLLLWQMPHFFAIGWKYRSDYRAAGFPLLPAIDPTGARTAAWSVAYTAALFVVSLVPWALGWLGPIYGVTAAIAGAGFLHCAWRFAIRGVERDRAAMRLFLASLVYLPVVMAALVLDRLL